MHVLQRGNSALKSSCGSPVAGTLALQYTAFHTQNFPSNVGALTQLTGHPYNGGSSHFHLKGLTSAI
jgi:hypothetical protein